MTAQAGWYPDPSGDAEKLRFWDGNQWTNDLMDAAAVRQQAMTSQQYQAQQQVEAASIAQEEQIIEAGVAVQMAENRQAAVADAAKQDAEELAEAASIEQEERIIEAGVAVQMAEESQAAPTDAAGQPAAGQPASAAVQAIEQSEDAQGAIQAQSVQDPIPPAQAVQEPLAQPLYGVQQANSQNTGGYQYYQQPNYGAPVTYVNGMNPDGTYIVDGTDSTLRLVAFIFYMLSLISILWTALFSFGFTLICLAWIIPMSIRCWSIYKGQKPNTIAFGVCTLLFVNVIAGILLLISKKDIS